MESPLYHPIPTNNLERWARRSNPSWVTQKRVLARGRAGGSEPGSPRFPPPQFLYLLCFPQKLRGKPFSSPPGGTFVLPEVRAGERGRSSSPTHSNNLPPSSTTVQTSSSTNSTSFFFSSPVFPLRDCLSIHMSAFLLLSSLLAQFLQLLLCLPSLTNLFTDTIWKKTHKVAWCSCGIASHSALPCSGFVNPH